jgi:hypothetical protein
MGANRSGADLIVASLSDAICVMPICVMPT